jgi:hypothetical protein
LQFAKLAGVLLAEVFGFAGIVCEVEDLGFELLAFGAE